MCNIMADDIRENAMTVSSSVDYVRGLKGKDSVLIAPGNLLSEVFQKRNRIGVGTDLNSILSSGTYEYFIEQGEVLNAPDMQRYILIVFDSPIYAAQFAISTHPSDYRIKYRVILNKKENQWSTWKSISIT